MSDSFRSRRRVLQATATAIGSGLLVGGAGADSDGSEVDDGPDIDEFPTAFAAELTGDAAVHDVDTDASGSATFDVDPDEKTIHYTVDVAHLCHPTGAHIHLGGEGEDGDIVAWLYPEEGQSLEHIEGRFDGTLAEGTVSAADLVGPLEDADLETVLERATERGVHVNVHTETYAYGEIRGQLEPDE